MALLVLYLSNWLDVTCACSSPSLAMKFYRQPEGYTNFLDVLNVVFTVFFTLEFLLKLAAFRFKVRKGLATRGLLMYINESGRFPPSIHEYGG